MRFQVMQTICLCCEPSQTHSGADGIENIATVDILSETQGTKVEVNGERSRDRGEQDKRVRQDSEVFKKCYFVVIDRVPGQPLGLELAIDDFQCALVSDVLIGQASLWNMQHPESVIRKGDRLLEVNGVQGDTLTMLKKLKQDSKVRMMLLRALTLRIQLSKDGKSLGLSLVFTGKAATLFIESVDDDGCIVQWSKGAGKTIKAGDRIFQANGTSDPRQMMRAAVKEDKVLDMWLYCYN